MTTADERLYQMQVIAACLAALILLFRFVALPLAQKHGGNVLPMTPPHELAAAAVTILHSYLASAGSAFVLMHSYFDAEQTCVVPMMRFASASGAYFVFDTLYLVWRDGARVVTNKFMAHHIVAMCLTCATWAGFYDAAACQFAAWYFCIETSNVFLKAWELTKQNRIIERVNRLHAVLAPMFFWTYVPFRVSASTWATRAIIWEMSWDPGHIVAASLVALIDVMSMYFCVRLVHVRAWMPKKMMNP